VINSLAVIMMQLMQSYEMDDGVIGVDDMERWPPYSEAFGFLEATSSARSIETLMKVSTLHYRSHQPAHNKSAPICGQTASTGRAGRASSLGPDRDKDLLLIPNVARPLLCSMVLSLQNCAQIQRIFSSSSFYF
jgi:hypothetical protein